jgi:hypothetical protein
VTTDEVVEPVIARSTRGTTTTVVAAVTTLPAESAAVKRTSVLPSGKPAGALLVTVTEHTSVATGVVIETGVRTPVACVVMGPGIESGANTGGFAVWTVIVVDAEFEIPSLFVTVS